MSQTGNTNSAEATIKALANAAGKVLPVVETVAAVLAPEAAAAVATAVAIAKGVAAEVPEALALWDQFQNGTKPSQDELDAYEAAEDQSFDKLIADIAAKQGQ